MKTETIKTCACGAEFTDDQSTGDACFKCKIRSLHWTFVGPTKRTRQNFHDTTIKEQIELKKRDMERAGTTKDFEPVTNWV